ACSLSILLRANRVWPFFSIVWAVDIHRERRWGRAQTAIAGCPAPERNLRKSISSTATCDRNVQSIVAHVFPSVVQNWRARPSGFYRNQRRSYAGLLSGTGLLYDRRPDQ